MTRMVSCLFVVGALLAAVAARVWAQPSLAGGQSTYGLYCATCHGPAGRGDGPMASVLTRKPADLTQIAARNKGVFDPKVVARIVDGQQPVKGHGGGEMPVWGDAFARSSDPTPAGEKIERVVAYLESIQEMR